MAPRRHARQGVVLLLILSLLVLFSLLGMTFLIGATRYRQGAESFGRHDLHGDDPAKLADLALFQILREPATPFSAVWGHSLLMDKYGMTGAVQGIADVGPVATAGDLVQVVVNNSTTNITRGKLSSFDDYYAGCVFSISDGSGPPQTSRVVRYIAPDAPGDPAVFFVERFERDVSGNNRRFLVNGKPFSGPGVGLDPASGYMAQGEWLDADELDGSDSDFLAPYALLPNYSRYAATGAVNLGGDANESYDALDYQNMFLAKNSPSGDRCGSFHRPELIRYWQEFWKAIENNGGVNRWTHPDSYAQTRNLVIFRPMPWDHPNFTGSNPFLTALVPDDRLMAALIEAGVRDVDGDGNIEGAYDVDNDGDGRLDSYWLDLQLPVKTDSRGRLYKPLVAFLIVDQDGRLNVNAHGNLAQIQTNYRIGDNPVAEGRRPYAGHPSGLIWNYEDPNEDGTAEFRLPRGMGFGPAEISFRHLVDDPNDRTDADVYEKYLIARYGVNNLPGARTTTEEALSLFKAIGRPTEYGATNSGTQGSWNFPSAFLNTPDVFGRGTVAVDYSGQPVWRYAGKADTFTRVGGGSLGSVNERLNHPYEINLVQPDGGDDPYTPADLEGLLRWRDSDAGLLSHRLFDPDGDGVLDLPTNFDSLSKLLTTHSSYSPSQPTVPLPRDNPAVDYEIFDILYPPEFDSSGNPHPLAQNAAKIAVRNASFASNWRMPTIMDLMAAKIVQGVRLNASSSNPTDVPNNVNGIPDVLAGRNALQQELNKMLAFELRHGHKLNPNRPWGNGTDDDGDGAVDEPDEEPGNGIWYDAGRTPNLYNVNGTSGFANDNPLSTPNANIWSQYMHPRSRAVFARHLFCLMMLLVDLDYTPTSAPAGQPQLEGFTEPFIDPTIPAGPAGQLARRELTIRRIAQWAVNVVDFRDADGIMTPFEYDVNPWNGWDVDGDITTDEGPGSDRRVVWGCEQPDLLLTEALAFHDRRVKDTASETDGDADGDDSDTGKKRTDDPEPDSTLDQYRMPQGSLFVELYCPRRNVYWDPPPPGTPTRVDAALAPPELYNVDAANGVRLDLGRLAPPDPSTNLRYPVWRLAITKSHTRGPEAGRQGPLELMAMNSIDTPSFPPRTDDQLPVIGDPAATTIQPLPIEREVWFTPLDPEAAGFPNHNRIYYNRYGPDLSNPAAPTRRVEIGAGEYLVVGPRARTFIGSEDTDADPGTPMSFDPNAQQEFRLVDGGGTPAFAFVNAATEPGYPNASQIKHPVKAIIAAANPPTNFTAPNLQADLLDGAGPLPEIPGTPLSVSEPLRDKYYPDEPNAYLEGSSTLEHPIQDTWGEDDGSGSVTLQPKDEPFETRSNPNPDYPVVADDLLTSGTYADYKTVYLQRLANPLAPYHPEYNPYITVDWHPIPITVFNGEDSVPADADDPETWDPDDPNADWETPPNFESSERTGEGNYNIWRTSFSTPNAHDGIRSTNDFLPFNVRHSLGYLNRKIDGNPDHFTVDPDPDFWVAPPAHPSVIGQPTRPFPWLTWNDRPYVSHLELMMVPSSSPSRLLTEFRVWGHTDPNGNPYPPFNITAHPAAASAGDPPYSSYRAPFGHLLNFFNTSNTPTATAATPNSRGANYYRIFDYVEVPSPFAGTEKWFNPSQFASGVTGTAADTFRPPFNYLPRFRDPGRVNINTIWDENVWRGINAGYPPFIRNVWGAPLENVWRRLEASMRNPTTITVDAPYFPSGSTTLPAPSAYPNPVRAAGSAGMTPVPNLEQPGVFATLLRRDPAAGTAPLQPLLDAPDDQYPSDPTDAQKVPTSPSRNAYFRYQGLQRLGNLVSTQSNVYAVWLTIGFFEVEPNPGGVDLAHPDGYRLGPELGSDTGDVRRHRAFYIIDRSIPVAFQPGVNHNVEKTILLRRIIE